MKNKNFSKTMIVVAILAALFVTSPAWGKEWKVDKAHSSVGFSVKHIFSKVWGYFSDFDGTIIFDPDNLNSSAFDFTVQVNSINTANGKRDNHLRSKDFFQADKYPVMKFTSSKIVHKGGKTYEVTGNMTLKGNSREMMVPFVFHGTAKSPFKKNVTVAGFDAEFPLNRLDFGVGSGKFYKMGVVDKTVNVFITIEALN